MATTEELADELTDNVGPERAEEIFDERADGEKEQQRRRGSVIDPDQGIEASHRSD